MPFVRRCPPPVTRRGDMSNQDRARAAQDWDAYARVEAYDTAVREVVLSESTVVNPPSSPVWYAFTGHGERAAYRRGQRLHAAAFPQETFTPAREQPLTPAQWARLGSTASDVEPCLTTRSVAVQPESARLALAQRALLGATLTPPYGDESARIAARTCG